MSNSIAGCGYNCHKACMKNVPNNCGINQKQMSEILSTIKKDGSKKTKRSNSNDRLSVPTKTRIEKDMVTIKDLNDLKSKEIRELEVERIRKKSEKLQLESKRGKQKNQALGAGGNAGNRQDPSGISSQRTNESKLNESSDESEDYYERLSDCTSKKCSFKDFCIVKLVGKGSFGKVFLVTTKNNSKYFAMKALKKDVVLQDDDVECTMLERDVCKLGNKNPYITKLFCTFQNEVS